MSGRCLRSSNPSSNGEEPIECMANLLVQQFKQGDIIWSRINGGSWWPLQVADEKCVSCKPKKIKNDEILVRLYGSFEHMYVDPANCVSKIEKIFGQEKSSNRDLFMRTLEEDITRMKSGGQSVATVSESKETTEIAEIEKEKNEASGGKGQRKGKLKRTMIADNSPLVGSSNNPKAAKQVKVVKSEGMNAVKTSEVGITKRRTRSETFKARSDGTSEIEVSNYTGNLNSGASAVSSFDKKDLRSSGHKDTKEKLTLNVLDKASESRCVKQDCGRNLDVNKNAQIEFSDVKDIKKLVAKIVKEVAEKARYDALKSRGMERCPENTEYIDNSRKKTSVIKKMKRHVPRRVKNTDTEVHITDGAIDDTQDRTAGSSDVEKPNGTVLSNGDPLNKIRDFECDNNERTRDTDIQLPNVVERANNEIQGINGVHRTESYFKEMNGDEKSPSNFAKQDEAKKPSETEEAINGDQRGKVVEHGDSGEKKASPNTTKCFLSPRCTKVMQSLGLIAPLGSPFCRNGLIRSLLP
ncbi:uncharacterized protein LOC110095904 [Dendrobium catenatum]|uniref:uncharacterized protein LOC110095904 n=1 Tax=Dendrobium catenatum TaxID=906689 RepID=UPI0009F238EF|nr:uncharacterized protein LOC110095904 [Dendrobium catenatum]XP_020677265.1 uncharacterized protein LOC110095904 [Dendrobium catenatum]XP_020677267.1 uncharacterized protein LOC110095904 [Dendrobium catenatum]